ncbi:flagellar hook-associated protein FlgK [Nocardioides sp. Bht2]|uniref:flagellar hook-associated protein FlgK n=1 Tax=Nocardioides sp. Bht2 TaxID=3392297 RepID=UPI0039B4140E
MAGTFGSFGIAMSGLRYSQVAIDVASNNVANVGTDGYVRRRVVGESVASDANPGLWSRGAGLGDGVRVAGVNRMVDQLLDARARKEHGTQAMLDTRLEIMSRIEAGLGEPGNNGINAALGDFRAAWQNLANNPGNDAARAQVLARANTLVDTIRQQSSNLSSEESDVRQRLLVDVGEVNQLAADLAATNRNVAAAKLAGVEAGVLLDQRDRLAMRLSELTGGTATVRPDGGYDFSVAGVNLVSGRDAGTLDVVSGVNLDGTGDGNPVTFQITNASGSTPLLGVSGSIGAGTDALDRIIPQYRSGLNDVVALLANQVNAGHQAGFDKAGNPGQAIFTFNAADPAGSLSVALTDGSLVAASSVPGGGLDGGNAELLALKSTVETDYQRLIAVFGTEVASAKRLSANQGVLTAQIDNTRESLSGVSIDEEMVNLMAAQRSYEAASRVITTMDSVLDTLINRTGLVR